MIEIKQRFTNNVLFACDAENMKAAVVEAVKQRANLSGANLSGADLVGEKLVIALISILNLTWDILITPEYLKIGCQRHTHEAWSSFTEKDISEMELRALEFWRQWKEPLLMMCAKHRVEAAKVKG